MEPTKRLTRSESDRMIAGICGGVAQFFGIDATLVRLAFVVFAIFGGGGLLAYLVMWLIVPTESKVDTAPRDAPRQSLEEMREGVERGAKEAKHAYRRWRGQPEEEQPPATPPTGDATADPGAHGAPGAGDEGPAHEPPRS